MNLCNEEFLKRNKIDKNELTKNVDSKIYSFSEINPLAEIVYFQKREERKNISIANIVGYNYQFYSAPNDIIESLDNFFDSEGDGYHSRSVGILEYDRDYILDKLQDSFKMEPMVVADTGEGKYTISTNGLHRFTVLRLLYLSEVVQAKGDPRKLDELEKKYTIPVQLQGIEFEKTYCKYLIKQTQDPNIRGFRISKIDSCIDENGKYDVTLCKGWDKEKEVRMTQEQLENLLREISDISSEFTQDHITDNVEIKYFNGENRILDKNEFIEFTKQKLIESENFKEIQEKVKENYSKYSSFKKFIDDNFLDLFPLKDLVVDDEEVNI